jgi:hypothetical protein
MASEGKPRSKVAQGLDAAFGTEPRLARAGETDWTGISPDGVEQFIGQVEAALTASAGDQRPEVVEFRGHAQPLIDAYRGRAVQDPAEFARHATWMTIWVREQGARVQAILDELRAKISRRP